MKLNLAGHTWTVERADFDDRWGETEPHEQTIRLAREIPASKLSEILIHECAHAIDVEFALNLTERQVRTLSLGLGQMLAPFLKVRGL